MSFEDRLIRGMDADREKEEKRKYTESIPSIIEEAHQRVLELFDDYQIQEEDLSETIGVEQIQRDKRKVERAEARFGDSGFLRKEAEVFEGIILREGEMSDWFGPGVETFKTSKFDDYFNKTDIVLEIEEGEDEGQNHFALGVDVTFSKGEHLGKKLDDIITMIEDGKLATIKYFQSENAGIEGRLKNIPHLVLGIERSNVEKLATRWMEGSKKEMSEDPVQFVILEEMRMQLEVFMRYAESLGKDDIVRAYRKALRVVNEIIAGKGEYDLGELENDGVFNYIKEQSQNLDKMIGNGAGRKRW